MKDNEASATVFSMCVRVCMHGRCVHVWYACVCTYSTRVFVGLFFALKFLLFLSLCERVVNNVGIQTACEAGYTHVVRELLKDPRADPSVDDNYCLRYTYVCLCIMWLSV